MHKHKPEPPLVLTNILCECVCVCDSHPCFACTSCAHRICLLQCSMCILKVPRCCLWTLESALKGQQLNKATALMESLLAFGFDFSLTSDQTGKQQCGVKKKKNPTQTTGFLWLFQKCLCLLNEMPLCLSWCMQSIRVKVIVYREVYTEMLYSH